MHVQLSKYGDGFTGMAKESPVMSLTASTHPEGILSGTSVQMELIGAPLHICQYVTHTYLNTSATADMNLML